MNEVGLLSFVVLVVTLRLAQFLRIVSFFSVFIKVGLARPFLNSILSTSFLEMATIFVLFLTMMSVLATSSYWPPLLTSFVEIMDDFGDTWVTLRVVPLDDMGLSPLVISLSRLRLIACCSVYFYYGYYFYWCYTIKPMSWLLLF